MNKIGNENLTPACKQSMRERYETEFSRKLMRMRLATCQSIAQTARNLHVTVSTFAQWEYGQFLPSPANIDRIKQYFSTFSRITAEDVSELYEKYIETYAERAYKRKGGHNG